MSQMICFTEKKLDLVTHVVSFPEKERNKQNQLHYDDTAPHEHFLVNYSQWKR